MGYHNVLNELIYISKTAGTLISENFGKSNNVNKKGRIDLVTETDIKVDQVISSYILEKFDNVTVVAEESYLNQALEENVFYIDPIDGTTNFVHGFPFVSISIGYYKNNEAICGVVYNPVLNELFTAEVGKGAFLNNNKLNVSSNNKVSESLIATGFPYNILDESRNVLFTKFKNIVKNARGIRRSGSASLDLCYTAKGVFDGYYETGLKPWDTAAGILILQEAGGKVTNIKGEKYSFTNDMIVTSNSLIHEEMIRILNI